MDQKPKVKFRRATPLDSVNIFRLLADDEKQKGSAIEQDDAARLAHILSVIATGYVLVVERSGRLLGSLGFGSGAPPYAKEIMLVTQWSVFLHGLDKNYQMMSLLLADVSDFADKYKTAVVLSVPLDSIPAEVIGGQGYALRGATYTRKALLADVEPNTAVEDDGYDEWLNGLPPADHASTDPV